MSLICSRMSLMSFFNCLRRVWEVIPTVYPLCALFESLERGLLVLPNVFNASLLSALAASTGDKAVIVAVAFHGKLALDEQTAVY